MNEGMTAYAPGASQHSRLNGSDAAGGYTRQEVAASAFLPSQPGVQQAPALPFLKEGQHQGNLGMCSQTGEMQSRAGGLLSVVDLSIDEVRKICSLASILEAEDPALRARRLFKRRIALLFYESSTRTRTSFELAAKALGADTTLVSSKSSSIEKGESLKDTGITLRALGAEAIILRHNAPGSAHLLAEVTGLPVLNAGDGMHEHPSQALLDLRTILARLHGTADNAHAQSLTGVTITICGDILHSRVARSNALLLPRLGAHVLLCGPAPLLPEVAAAIGPNVSIERDFDRALEQSQIVMMLRIQAERLAGLHLDLEDYKRRYQAGIERIGRYPEIVVMHPGPIIRGLEIEGEVADGPQSVIEEQVRNGVSIRMALVARALGATALASSKA